MAKEGNLRYFLSLTKRTVQQEIPKAGRKADFTMYPRKKTENQGLNLLLL